MSNYKYKTLTICAIIALFLASCASTNQKTAPPIDDSANNPTTLDSPLAPVSTSTAPSFTKTKASGPKIKAVPSIIDKMEAHSRTLYWRAKDSYTYYHGGVLEAEYKPGKGITLREDKAENAIECHFNEVGNLALDNPGTQKKSDFQKKCSQLMFTFDEEISE